MTAITFPPIQTRNPFDDFIELKLNNHDRAVFIACGNYRKKYKLSGELQNEYIHLRTNSTLPVQTNTPKNN